MRKTVLVSVVLAAALGGCGSSHNDNQANDYALRVQQAQFHFADTFDKATTKLLQSTLPRHDAAALRSAAHAVDADVKELGAIPPPDKVRALHRRLVAALQGYATQLRRAAKLVAGGDPHAFLRAKRLLTRSSKQISQRFNTIISQINAQLL